jgi:inner membrane protein
LRSEPPEAPLPAARIRPIRASALPGYPIAAAALIALITIYIAGATTNPRSAWGIGAALSASYAALYVILVSDDNALLYGSLLLFAVLAALMLATRRLDWSRVGRRE